MCLCYGRGATSENRMKIGVFEGKASVWPKILGTRGRGHPMPTILSVRKVEWYFYVGIRILAVGYLVSSQCTHGLTDGRTDRQISTARPCVSIRTVETEANVVVSECTATACHRVSCIKFCVIYTFYTQHAQKKPACYGAERARMYSTNDKANIIGVARGCTGCTRTPRAEKNGAKFTAESCNCTPRQRVHPLQKSNF